MLPQGTAVGRVILSLRVWLEQEMSLCNTQLYSTSAGRGAVHIVLSAVLQHGAVERQVRHDPLEAPVLLLKLAHALHLGRHHPGIFRLPRIIRRLANAGLATHLFDRRAVLALPNDEPLCPSENFDSFMAFSSSQPGKIARNFPVQREGLLRERITRRACILKI